MVPAEPALTTADAVRAALAGLSDDSRAEQPGVSGVLPTQAPPPNTATIATTPPPPRHPPRHNQPPTKPRTIL